MTEITANNLQFSQQEIARATAHFNRVDSTVKASSERLTALAKTQGHTHFEASSWIMRLTWSESTEKPGFYDCPSDIWPTDRHPDSSQLQGSALILWQWLQDLGWSPYTERALFAPLGYENRSLKPAGDFRGYFFYIGIRWNVTLLAPEATKVKPIEVFV